MDLDPHNDIENAPLQFDKHIYSAEFKACHTEHPGKPRKIKWPRCSELFNGTLNNSEKIS